MCSCNHITHAKEHRMGNPIVNNASPLSPKHLEDYQQREKTAEEELALTKKQDELVDQFIAQFKETAEQKEEIQNRDSAKEAIHTERHEKLMAIMEETNKINKDIIQKLMKALADKKVTGGAAISATPPPTAQTATQNATT